MADRSRTNTTQAKVMTRYQSRLLHGIFIGITGIFLFSLSVNPSGTIQYIVAGGMFLSATFAFISAGKSEDSIIRIQYYWFQSLGMFVYALLILFYGTTAAQFLAVTSAFILYYGITEILFGFELLAHKKEFTLLIIVIKMVVGFIMTIGAVFILAASFVDERWSLFFAGLLMFLSGLNFILLARIMK